MADKLICCNQYNLRRGHLQVHLSESPVGICPKVPLGGFHIVAVHSAPFAKPRFALSAASQLPEIAVGDFLLIKWRSGAIVSHCILAADRLY